MEKSFEEAFSEIQTDMIAICLEYVENRAEEIFIYSSYENKMISCDYFYKIAGNIMQRHKLPNGYDTSIQRQKACMKILNEDMKKIIHLCKEFKQDIPTEMKIVYCISQNSVAANYKYDVVYSNDPEKTADDMAEEWFIKEKEKLEKEIF